MPLWCGVFRGHLQGMGGGPWETAAEALVRIYFGRLNAAFMQPLKTGRHTSPAEDQAWSNLVCGWGRAGAIGGARAGRPMPCRQWRIELWSVSAAMILIGPQQSGHFVTSMRKTRASNMAQERR